MSKTVKSVSKAVSSAVPKIKMDPTKLVSKAVEGATNLQKDIFIKPAVDLASTAVAGVGQVMSQPGAGAVLGAAGTAFGIPGAGLLAGAMTGSQPATMAPAPAPMVQAQAPIIIPQSGGDSGNSNNTMMIAGVAMGGLLLIVVLFLGMRKR